MYATLAEVSETERDLEGTGLTPKKDTKKKRTSTATSTGPSTAEDPIQDLLRDQEDQEALMCNRVKQGGVPIFRECTRECLFLMEISPFPSMLFLVTGSHMTTINNR